MEASADASGDDLHLALTAEDSRAAFDAMCREHYRRLVSALRLGGASPQEAEDIAQEAFIRTFTRWSRLAHGTNPPGHVYRVAFRLQRSPLRRIAITAMPFGRDPGVDGHEGQVVTNLLLQAALGTLSPQQRRVVAPCIYLELAPTEAADIPRLRPGAVRVHLHEARQRLQDALGQQTAAIAVSAPPYRQPDDTASPGCPMNGAPNDPVPLGLVLDLYEAFRVLEALEDARHELASASLALGLCDELITVIRLIHRRLGFDEGGVR